ncbi:CDP-alcohol phosphatidyltransferase family protein [Fictibacillus sp. Mic-4]|uniref:CDP-alcohol phosphatidyltransferase family protein n=1 Tax=Fictibacillus TaxID=1329200 RepID=UPI00041642E1|nr:CDP-alcohol phosphatidyltransferase family protein [Fictibacillus gelatini]
MSQNKRATLPWDSEKILALRQFCQKDRELEDIWTWYVLRRISIYFSLLFCKLKITPNTITWVSFLSMLIAGYCMVFASSKAFLLAFLFYNIGFLCDCIDGEMARIQKKTSNYGYFLDILIQATSIPIYSSIGIALIQLQSGITLSVTYASIIYWMMVTATMSLSIAFALQLTASKVKEIDPVNQIRVKSNLFEWVGFFTGLPGFFFVLFLLNLIGLWLPDWLERLYMAGFLALFFAKAIVRLKITLGSLGDQASEN